MKISRREFLRISLSTIAALPFVTTGYGFMIEPSWIELTHITVPIPGLKPQFVGFRIAHVSDIHVGTYISQKQLQEVIGLVNSQNADLIVHTGDFVGVRKNREYYNAWKATRRWNTVAHLSGAEDLYKACIPALATMRSKYGAIAVLGNHEHWADVDLARKYLKDYSIKLLENSSQLITIGDASLNFAGVGDLWEGEQDLDAAYAGSPDSFEAPRIVLSHNPDFADSRQVGRNKVALMLSGHTHGGQVTIPGIGAPLVPISNKRYIKGLVDTDWGKIFISKGVGCTTPPIRLFTRPEIAILELTAG